MPADDPILDPWSSFDEDDEDSNLDHKEVDSAKRSDQAVKQFTKPEPEEKLSIQGHEDKAEPVTSAEKALPPLPRSTFEAEPQITSSDADSEPQHALTEEVKELRKKIEELQGGKAALDPAQKIQEMEKEMARMDEQLKEARSSSQPSTKPPRPQDSHTDLKPFQPKSSEKNSSSVEKAKISNIFKREKK